MTGQYTKVPLRREDRWASAPIQAGRPLLDHELNLTTEALQRTHRHGLSDVIGKSGVLVGTGAFELLKAVLTDGGLAVTLGAGRMWVDGLEVLGDPDRISEPLTATLVVPGGGAQGPPGRVLLFLDAWAEHVQPAELPALLVDPAIAPIDSAARTRIGWQLGLFPTGAITCVDADLAFDRWVGDRPNGTLDVTYVKPAAAADPCDPPGAALARVADGLLRIEVLDHGDAASARFAWSFDDGASALPVTGFTSGSKTVDVDPIGEVAFRPGDLVELSWLGRRPARIDHGELYEVAQANAGTVQLSTAITGLVPTFDVTKGFALRRWDGQVVGADNAVIAKCHGEGVGAQFLAEGDFEVGDWWGSRVREAATPPFEERLDAKPDGVDHVFAPLALIKLDDTATWTDCRSEFDPITLKRPVTEMCTCTVVAFPGDDLPAKIEELVEKATALAEVGPFGGAELCLAAGRFDLADPLVISGQPGWDLVVTGVGAATVIECHGDGVAVEQWGSVSVRDLTIRHLESADKVADALQVRNCRVVDVRDCRIEVGDELSADEGGNPNDVLPRTWEPEAAPRAAVRIFMEPMEDAALDSIVARVERVECLLGHLASGIVIQGMAETQVNDCRVDPLELGDQESVPVPLVAIALRTAHQQSEGTFRTTRVMMDSNRVSGCYRGIWVITDLEPSDFLAVAGIVQITRSLVRVPWVEQQEWNSQCGIEVQHGRAVHLGDNDVVFEPPKKTQAMRGVGLRLVGAFGGLVSVRTTSVVDGRVGIDFTEAWPRIDRDGDAVTGVWVVDQLLCQRMLCTSKAELVRQDNSGLLAPIRDSASM